jgi:hydrogenase maturation protein HypF
METCRPTLGLLYETVGSAAFDLPLVQRVDPALREGLAEMIVKAAGTVATSSLGRFFDAAAFLSGVAEYNHFEGQAPMALEAVIVPDEEHYPHAIEHHVEARVEPGRIAARFHNTLGELLKAAALIGRDLANVHKVVLSGGCFANRYLSARLTERLEAVGFEVFSHRVVPCNDGGVAVGQAVHAAVVTNASGCI